MKPTIFPLLVSLAFGTLLSACGGGGGGGSASTPPPPPPPPHPPPPPVQGAPDSGAVYVFTRDGAGVWSQQAYIKASNTDVGDRFGWSVALSGDTLAVGASGEDSAATGIDGDQSNTGFSGTVVAVHAFGSDPNAINPSSKDVIPVAVLGSVNFDATQLDFSTAEFGPGKASPIHGGHVEDVNNDDIFDMVFHFNTQDTGIDCGDFRATLSGETFGGEAFTGTVSVKTAGCQ